MTTGIASGSANALLDSWAGTVYVKLHTDDPGSAGTSHASAGDASLKEATMSSAAAGSKAMSGTAGPWTNSGTSETISHISLWDAASSGNFIGSAVLDAEQGWVSGNTFTLSSLTLSFSPVAA